MQLNQISFLIFFLILAPFKSFASISLIRDSQTEEFLRNISEPIFIEAGQSPNDIAINIINNKNLNAFVSNGRKLFINSGLIIASDDIESLIGVIAHETAHIAGSHLSKLTEEVQNVQTGLVVGYVLGLAAAVSGNPDAGQALMLGSSHIANRTFLTYTRNHEDAADEAALKYLANLNINPNGMLNFFKKIKAKENLSTNSSDLYSRTHPLTNDRMLRIKNRIAELNISDFKQYNIELQENFKYIKIKFDTFLADFPEDLLEKYTSNNNFDLYGRAIINHRLGNSKKAIKLIDKLIKKDNDNPFFIELKAQFYYESGKAYKALENFQLATILRPNDPLFKIQIAESIISLANKNFYNLAFNNIQSALLIEYDNAYAWKKLSEIYSLNNQSNLSDLALAEHYYYSAKYEEALFLAEKILNIFNKDQTLYSTQNITRAKEIIDFSNKKLDKNN